MKHLKEILNALAIALIALLLLQQFQNHARAVQQAAAGCVTDTTP